MPLQTYVEPPKVAARFNTTAHDERKLALQAAEEQERQQTVKARRDMLRESERLKREANKRLEMEGSEAHKQNMKVYRAVRQREQEIVNSVHQNKQSKRDKSYEEARHTTFDGIDAFEHNLRRLGIDTKTKQTPPVPTEKLPVFDDVDYFNRIRARKVEEVTARKERTKRRQKMILDQQKVYSSIYEGQRQEQLMEKVAQQSRNERQLAHELQKQAQWKHVMAANRKFRAQQYEERKKKEEEELREATEATRQMEREAYERGREEELRKTQEVLHEKEEAKKAKRYETCRGIAHQLVELTCKVVAFREKTDAVQATFGEAPLIPPPTWREWLLQFMTDTDDVTPADDLPELHSAAERDGATESEEVTGEGEATPAVGQETPSDGKARAQEVLAFLNSAEIASYIRHDHEWAVPPKPPRGCEFNEFICGILFRIHGVLHPPREPFTRRFACDGFVLVVFVGKNLSGKSMAAKAVADGHSLEHCTVKKILLTALTSCTTDPEALFANLSDHRKALVKERCDLARKARREQLDQGSEVSDDILVGLVVNHFKWLISERDALREAGETTSLKRGMLIDGFPRTVEQLRLLEEACTTYSEAALRPPPDEDLAPFAYRAEPNVDFSPPPAPLRTVTPPPAPQEKPASKEMKRKKGEEPAEPQPPQSETTPPAPLPDPLPELTEEERAMLEYKAPDATAIDLAVHFDVPDNEIFARYSGERIDPMTGEVYHIIYNPPPDDVLLRVQEVSRSACDATALHNKLISHRHNHKRMVKWFERTGRLENLDGNRELAVVIQDAHEMVGKVLAKVEEEVAMAAKRGAFVERRREAEQQYKAAMDETRQQAATPLDDIVSVVSTNVPQQQNLPVELDEQSCELLVSQWHDLTDLFFTGVREVLVKLRKLRKECVEHFVLLSRQFKAFLDRPDGKQKLVTKFQDDFNSFEGELRRDKQGMDELHLRTDGLQAELWKEVDYKKEEGEQEVQSFQKSAWMDMYRRNAQMQFVSLMEVEVYRFLHTRRFVQFYYGVLWRREVKGADALPDFLAKEPEADAPKTTKKDAKKATPPAGKGRGKDAVPEVTDEEKGDEFQAAYRRIVEWVETPDEGETQPPEPKTKHSHSVQLDEVRVDPVECFARVVLGRERELLKYRLEAICAKYYDFVEEAQEKQRNVCSTLLSWLREQYKREMAAVAALIKKIRTTIEEQSPLVHELILEGGKLIVDESAVLLPPQPHDEFAVPSAGDEETVPTDWVTKNHTLAIIAKFKGRSAKGLISRDDFVRLFLKITATSAGMEQLPECWLRYTRDEFDAVFNTFDWEQKGVVDWRQFCVSLLLWSGSDRGNVFHVGVPALAELVELRDALYSAGHSPFIAEEAFKSTPFWFSKSRLLSQERAAQLVGLLWEVFKSPQTEGDGEDAVERDVVHIPTFLLYLCSDPQVIRGGQKAFNVLDLPGGDGQPGCLTRDQIYLMFHFSPYLVCDDTADDMYSMQTIESIFESVLHTGDGYGDYEGGESEPAEDRIAFTQLCGWHMGRVMLNNAHGFQLRRVVFESS